jgi:phage tail-like protein
VTAPLPPDTIRYAVLRADDRWSDVALDGLEILPDGAIELRRVPAVSPPHVDAPGRADPSGIALDRRCGLYVVDTAARRLVRDALDCPGRSILEGNWFQEPIGVCVGPFGWVFVADAAAGRVLVLSTPELSVRDAWSTGLSRPFGVAADDGRGIYVLDAEQRVLRFDAFGTLDEEFAALVLPPATPTTPQAIAAAADGTLFVAGGPGEGVVRFTPSGASAGPALAPGTSPQALVVGGEILYAADKATGEILLVSIADGDVLGAVAGFRGPVAALAADAEGRLYVKPGLDDSYLVAQPRAGRVASGTLVTAAPLDPGEDAVWLRATADAEAPTGTRVTLDVSPDSPGAGPSWYRASAPDSLLKPSRYVSLRVTLTGLDGSSPVLRQVRAETPGDSYFQYLPAVYSRDPEASRPLARLLALAKAELGDLETEIGLLPQRFRTATADDADLERLANLLALPVPETWSATDGPSALRALLDEVEELYASRGTPRGLRRALDIYADAEAVVLEEFDTRGIWRLDTAGLGFDTRVASTSVDGLVVGSSSVGASGPEAAESWGSALFAETAHRFSVVLPGAGAPSEDARRRLRATIEREKPAHSSYHLCFSEPRLRVGVQSQVGLDAIVAGREEGLQLDTGARLGLDSRTDDEPEGAPAAVGRRGRVGVDALLG